MPTIFLKKEWGPYSKRLGIEKVDLDELLSRADFIIIHTALTDTTRNIIRADVLNKTKKGVRIINGARCGLLDELALAAAINASHLAGAALDVFVNEPARGHALFGFDNVVTTLHLGVSTLAAQEKVLL